MRINPNETFESWVARVEMFEKGLAMQRIALGDNVENVMEDMSRRIMDKLIHPILKSFEQTKLPSVEESRKKYEEIMKNVAKAADHVDTNT